jgi:hypothetical protein
VLRWPLLRRLGVLLHELRCWDLPGKRWIGLVHELPCRLRVRGEWHIQLRGLRVRRWQVLFSGRHVVHPLPHGPISGLSWVGWVLVVSSGLLLRLGRPFELLAVQRGVFLHRWRHRLL